MALMIARLLERLRNNADEPIDTVHGSRALFGLLEQMPALPALVVLDLSLPGLKRLRLLRLLRERHPRAMVLAYTDDPSPFLAMDAIRIGVQGYVRKHSTVATLVRAVRALQKGRGFHDPRIGLEQVQSHPWMRLTPRQREICLLLYQHGSVRRTAEAEGKDYDTIWNHWANARRRLGIRREAELAKYFHVNGLMYLVDD